MRVHVEMRRVALNTHTCACGLVQTGLKCPQEKRARRQSDSPSITTRAGRFAIANMTQLALDALVACIHCRMSVQTNTMGRPQVEQTCTYCMINSALGLLPG